MPVSAFLIMVLLVGAGVENDERTAVFGADVVTTGEISQDIAQPVETEAMDTAEENAEQETSEPVEAFLTVNGIAPETEVYHVFQNSTTYVSLREVAPLLDSTAQVSWVNGAAVVTTSGLTLAADCDVSYVVANGRYLYVENGLFSSNGMTMIPLTTLVQAFDAQLAWDSETRTIDISIGSGAIVSADSYYNADDLYWISRIISAESGNQPLDGKIAVGNVILNRVRSTLFPNSVYNVIFATNQFSPVKTGSINKEPNAQSMIAAKLCLEGVSVVDNALYFNRAGVSCWASRNRTLVATIGDHAFYA